MHLTSFDNIRSSFQAGIRDSSNRALTIASTESLHSTPHIESCKTLLQNGRRSDYWRTYFYQLGAAQWLPMMELAATGDRELVTQIEKRKADLVPRCSAAPSSLTLELPLVSSTPISAHRHEEGWPRASGTYLTSGPVARSSTAVHIKLTPSSPGLGFVMGNVFW